MAGCEDDLHLPPEICIEILNRVPIKSILRFRSVCKSWLSLVSCPNFILKTLLDRILLNRFDHDVWSLSSHDVSFSESRHNMGEDLPDRFRGLRLSPIGSCHGLICFFDYREDLSKKERTISSFIYNPAIRKIVELPSLSFGRRTDWPCYCGFGFDSKASDYKVMLILKVYEDEIETSYMGFMFDLGNGVWREFTPIILDYWESRRCFPEFYLNDALHWFGYSREHEHEYVAFILSFSMSDETFRVTPMPAELSGDCYLIMPSGGLVYALAGGGGEMSDPGCSVWVMKEYGVTESWTKVFTFDMPPQFWPAYVYPIIFRGPEVARVLLRYYQREAGKKNIEQLILHNNESGESKCLLSTDKLIDDLFFYKESLVLM